MGMKQVIKNLDAFPRTEDHLLQKTQSGALGNSHFCSSVILFFLQKVCIFYLIYDKFVIFI